MLALPCPAVEMISFWPSAHLLLAPTCGRKNCYDSECQGSKRRITKNKVEAANGEGSVGSVGLMCYVEVFVV